MRQPKGVPSEPIIYDRSFKGKIIELDTPIEQLSYEEIMWLVRNYDKPVLIRTRNA